MLVYVLIPASRRGSEATQQHGNNDARLRNDSYDVLIEEVELDIEMAIFSRYPPMCGPTRGQQRPSQRQSKQQEDTFAPATNCLPLIFGANQFSVIVTLFKRGNREWRSTGLTLRFNRAD